MTRGEKEYERRSLLQSCATLFSPMRVFDRLVVNVHDGDQVAHARIGAGRGGGMSNKEKSKNIITKFKEYRYSSQQTYESISRELNVSYATVVRWLNSTKDIKISPVYIQALTEFLKKKGVNVLLGIIVSWQLNFKSSGDEWTKYLMEKEFNNYREVADFVMRSPEYHAVFECEHWSQPGYCSVSDFNIDSNEDEEETK